MCGELSHGARFPFDRRAGKNGLQIQVKCIHFIGSHKPQTQPMNRARNIVPLRPLRRKEAPALAPNGAGASAGSTERIVEAITTAIIERRLVPGTKLAEQKIADIFKVSRTILLQALNRLSRDKLVTLEPARGARVAEPSIEEARQVFEVRHMLESALARRLAATITPEQVAKLRAHLADEQASVKRIDVSGRTRLLADFHVVLARMLGNQTLAELLADLLSRCSLIALMYQSAHSAEHSFEEHVAIVDALEKHDARTAQRLMEEHLLNVERNLRLDPGAPDLEAALMPKD
jgi:DNA-binding GntR family transcriptional regulator